MVLGLFKGWTDALRYKVRPENGGRNCASKPQNEQDPKRMLEIVEKINRLLAVKYDRISHANGAPPKTPKDSI
jgi:hypothetical protein